MKTMLLRETQSVIVNIFRSRNERARAKHCNQKLKTIYAVFVDCLGWFWCAFSLLFSIFLVVKEEECHKQKLKMENRGNCFFGNRTESAAEQLSRNTFYYVFCVYILYHCSWSTVQYRVERGAEPNQNEK